jgi:hypothetical protein
MMDGSLFVIKLINHKKERINKVMNMRKYRWMILRLLLCLTLIPGVIVSAQLANQWTPIPVEEDPLVRMPGTQPGQVSLEGPNRCTNCHEGYNQAVEPGFNWKGSMMAQSSRDFLFWATLTVAAQDSIHVLGNPNATDLCMRCHFPKGWLEGRSDPTNASKMTGADYDGVQCDLCHRMWDPHFEQSYAGDRESLDWLYYWDETNKSSTPSSAAAKRTYDADVVQSGNIRLFNGDPFFNFREPFSPDYTEAASGQYFVSSDAAKRASFADANARHKMEYSRFHKSKYFCAGCHDVSNPVLANLLLNTGGPELPSETLAAFSYYHVERTFSEFMLSDYGQQGGAPGIGPFAPGKFITSTPDNNISRCQDCHMRDGIGKGADKASSILRPDGSIEHPNSGQPIHDLTGGNIWVPAILASTVSGSPNYDAVNASLLRQGANVLTLDLNQGLGLDPAALLAGAERSSQQLELAAEIKDLTYVPDTGQLSFKIQNQTGHKLISGFPEGRRMFVNIQAYNGNGDLVYEVNPYDFEAATMKGLDYPYQNGFGLSDPANPGSNERYIDKLVFEMKPSSDLTNDLTSTFHFVLGTGRYKDNRIPPKGFRIKEAPERHSEPVWEGQIHPGYFTKEEYKGGYHQVQLDIPENLRLEVKRLEVNLYYQTTSREYIEFLRDEINGNGNRTLPDGAYVAQTDPFFEKLRAWGDTIWELWLHNRNLPGAAPYLMTQSSWGEEPSDEACEMPGTPQDLMAGTGTNRAIPLTWSSGNPPPLTAYNIYYDQAGKMQLVDTVPADITIYTDLKLKQRTTYCYVVTAINNCGDVITESLPSNVACGTTK